MKERIPVYKEKQELIAEMRAEYHANIESLGRNLYLNERHFKKSAYTYGEVKTMLTSMGHKFVPRALEHVFPIQQKALYSKALDVPSSSIGSTRCGSRNHGNDDAIDDERQSDINVSGPSVLSPRCYGIGCAQTQPVDLQHRPVIHTDTSLNSDSSLSVPDHNPLDPSQESSGKNQSIEKPKKPSRRSVYDLRDKSDNRCHPNLSKVQRIVDKRTGEVHSLGVGCSCHTNQSKVQRTVEKRNGEIHSLMAVSEKRKNMKTTSKFLYQSGSTRRKMQQAGLYDTPSDFSDEPIVVSFYSHMIGVRRKPIEHIKNSVRNICRILYQIMGSDSKVNTELITKPSIKAIVDKLKAVPLSNQTIANYLKSLIMFLKYLRDVSHLTDNRPDESERFNRLVMYCKEMNIGFYRTISEDQHLKQTTQFPIPPPNLYEVGELSRKLEPIAEVLFQKAKNKTVLRQFEVSKVNAYIAADIGLNQGRRPSELTNVLKAEYDLALRDPRFHYNGVIGVPCAKHKTSKKYTAMLMLDERQKRYFDIYAKFIRKSIVSRTKTKCQHFLLQHDGNPFYKVTVAIDRYQVKYNIPKIDFTLSRKSIQTYNQKLSQETQAKMNSFMTHTEKTRDLTYRAMDIKDMVESRCVINKLQLYFSQNKHLHVAPSSDELAGAT